jgi:hypothetical protein
MTDQDGTDGLEAMLNSEAAMSSTDAPAQSLPPAQVPTPKSKTRKGNEVFKNPAAAPLKEDYAKREFGIEIPVDAVPLPSGGKLYPEGHPLHHAQHVEYRAMTAKEEDILMSPALIKRGTVISELIKSCVVDKTINVNSLVSGDRNALMIAIRISGYDRMYQPTFQCGDCGHKNVWEVDLASLDLKPLTIEPSVPGENLFAFTLPKTGKKIEFKFLTGIEEERIMKDMEGKKKRGLQNNNLVTTRLLTSIVSVDGDSHPGLIAKFVTVMPASDSLALRQYIDKHEPGVDMEVEFTCSACDHYDAIQLPLGSNFFWPGS